MTTMVPSPDSDTRPEESSVCLKRHPPTSTAGTSSFWCIFVVANSPAIRLQLDPHLPQGAPASARADIDLKHGPATGPQPHHWSQERARISLNRPRALRKKRITKRRAFQGRVVPLECRGVPLEGN